jgi:deoxyribonuclease IV
VFFGGHISALGGIHTTLDRAEAMRAETVQLFTQSPRMWRPTNHDPANFETFKHRRQKLHIAEGGVLAHALYLVNLAASDKEIRNKSRAALHNTVEVACAIDADGVVFHVGSHLGAGLKVGMKRCVPAIKAALDLCSDTTWLLMEDSAGAGGTIGRSVDELAQLFDACDGHERLGVCLDTCHLFVSGIDITKREVVDELLEELDGRIGLDRLRALHVNDARDPLGSNRDRHANVLEGLMGEGLGAFLAHPAFQGLGTYLEVPGKEKKGPDADEVRKLRELHARWTTANPKPKPKRRRAKQA